jgi:hypothetical protein
MHSPGATCFLGGLPARIGASAWWWAGDRGLLFEGGQAGQNLAAVPSPGLHQRLELAGQGGRLGCGQQVVEDLAERRQRTVR